MITRYKPTGEDIAAALVRAGKDATVEGIESLQRRLGGLKVKSGDVSAAVDAAVRKALETPGYETRLNHEKGRISLAIVDHETPRSEWDVVAAMTHYEGTGCWRVTDVRLSRARTPSPYAGDLNADVLCSSYKPESGAEAASVRQLLREYREEPDGSFLWCTFDGIVRGAPEVKGHRPAMWADFDQAGFFSRSDALATLREIQSFWATYTGPRNAARIPNPHRQPGEFEIGFLVRAQPELQRPADSESPTIL